MFESLLSEAVRHAEFCLRNIGQIPSPLFAHMNKGTPIYLAEGMEDGQDKDDFVTRMRLIAGSYAATDVVLMLESWVTMARKSDP